MPVKRRTDRKAPSRRCKSRTVVRTKWQESRQRIVERAALDGSHTPSSTTSRRFMTRRPRPGSGVNFGVAVGMRAMWSASASLRHEPFVARSWVDHFSWADHFCHFSGARDATRFGARPLEAGLCGRRHGIRKKRLTAFAFPVTVAADVVTGPNVVSKHPVVSKDQDAALAERMAAHPSGPRS
jgi:hypothetical protein